MVEKARIYLTEDFDILREVMKGILETAGHQVIYEAGNLPQALKGVEVARDQQAHAALLDGNLSEGDISNQDGRTIAKALKEAVPSITVIAFTGARSHEQAGYGDHYVWKQDDDGIEKIIQIIDDIKP